MTEHLYGGELDADAASWLVKNIANPYLSGQIAGDRWMERTRYLRRPDWIRRIDAAHDLRTGDPFWAPLDVVIEAKRRYQWAETSWLAGWLDARAFLKEARSWDAAIAVFRSMRPPHPITFTAEGLAREERRLRQTSRDGYFDTGAWSHWAQTLIAYRDAEEQWSRRKAMARETRRQRSLLRQGHQTMTAIRRRLHGAGALPPQASQPARTSPI